MWKNIKKKMPIYTSFDLYVDGKHNYFAYVKLLIISKIYFDIFQIYVIGEWNTLYLLIYMLSTKFKKNVYLYLNWILLPVIITIWISLDDFITPLVMLQKVSYVLF